MQYLFRLFGPNFKIIIFKNGTQNPATWLKQNLCSFLLSKIYLQAPCVLKSSYDYYDGGVEFLCYTQEPPTAERRQRRCESECQTAFTGPRLDFQLLRLYCSNCSVFSSYAVQCSVVQFAREVVRPGNSLCPNQARPEVTFASQRSPCLRTPPKHGKPTAPPPLTLSSW